MPRERSNPKPDPLIAKLSERANGEPVAELQGYVGPSEDEVIRLYESRQMITYVDIPKTAVLHIVEPENENEPTAIYTLASTRVRFTTVRSATLPAEQVPAFAVPQGSFGLGERGIDILNRLGQTGIIIVESRPWSPGQTGIIIVENRPWSLPETARGG